MKAGGRNGGEFELINPYIALTDVLINLVLIFMFFSAAILFMGRLGKDDIKYRDAQEAFKTALTKKFPGEVIWNEMGRNDPPGSQRWVFPGKQLFEVDSMGEGTAKLTKGGTSLVLGFAEVLNRYASKWRRLRIEGHTRPKSVQRPGDWDLSARRAASVAELLASDGHVRAYFMSVSGRAGQNPIYPGADNRGNDRVEFVIEYSRKTREEGTAKQ